MKNKSDMNFWFIGTGHFAAALLPMLAVDFNFGRIITRTPSKANRGLKEEITPVERAAIETGLIPSRTPLLVSDTSLRDDFFKNTPDGVFVIDFGEKISDPFLTGTKFGCLNIHPSLLPKYRGAAPIQRALENGENYIGVTLFLLTEEMDAGPIILQTKEDISIETDYTGIMNRTAVLGSELANEWLRKIINTPDQVLTCPQDHDAATYAPKILKSESHQSFNITAKLLHNRVRAFCPNPGVWVLFREKRLKLILTYPLEEADSSSEAGEIIGFQNGSPVVKCKVGSIVLKQVQPEGKRIMNGADWINGLHLPPESGEWRIEN